MNFYFLIIFQSLLCGEMEITGQVWDELQAQNTRLHQLLREKDEENLKLMTERVKSNQLYNLSKEENENMMQHVIILLLLNVYNFLCKFLEMIHKKDYRKKST